MRRDSHGIIIQTSSEDPLYEDGGDSAFATGLMAMTNNKQDLDLMWKFIKCHYRLDNGKEVCALIRHPYQEAGKGNWEKVKNWNDPRETSRDQLVAFTGGLKNLKHGDGYEYFKVRKAVLNYAKGWWINKDILMPDVRLYLYLAAEAKVPPLIWLFGWPLAFISLLWDCFINPNHEMNQAICKNTVYGKWWLSRLASWHPDIYKNVDEYFNGWRDKREIGVRIKAHISSNIDK